MLLKTNTPYALSIAQTRYEAYASYGTGISIIITCSVETKASSVNRIPLVWDPQCLLFMQILFIFFILLFITCIHRNCLLHSNDQYKHNTR